MKGSLAPPGSLAPLKGHLRPHPLGHFQNYGKTHGFARFWHPCRGYVGPALRLCWSILGLCWPILGLCWPVLGLCWPILGARLSHLGAILARLEAMLAQHARKKRQKTNKRRIRPRFPPGSAAVLGQVWPSYGAMLADVGDCVASARPFWADLGPMLPHLDSTSVSTSSIEVILVLLELHWGRKRPNHRGHKRPPGPIELP